MSPLLVRVLSAAFALIVLFSTSYFLKHTGVLWLGYIVIFMGCNEYMRLIQKIQPHKKQYRLLFLVSSAILILLDAVQPEQSYQAIAAFVVLYAVSIIYRDRKQIDLMDKFKYVLFFTFGLVYTVMFPLAAVGLIQKNINSAPFFLFYFLYLLAVVFIGDTMAYFGGRAFGNKKLMPALSPKKTVEGMISGLLGSMLCSLFFAFYLPIESPTKWIAAIVIGLITGLCGQSGDLFESLIKRLADEKDSGRLLPGHGGVLDRLDGVYFAAPVFAYLLALFKF